MTYYRLYYFGGRNGRIDHFREFEAIHDAAAIVQSGEWRSAKPMELWARGRKVMRWEEIGADRSSRRLPVSAFWLQVDVS
jgi:hypothetical protein